MFYTEPFNIYHLRLHDNDLAGGAISGQNRIRKAMTMPAPAPPSDPYALWRNPNYCQYAGSWFLITFSRRIEFAVIGLYLTFLYDIKQASFAVGLVGLVQALPVILLAIPGGQLADRFDRHRVMTLSFTLGIVSSIGLLATVLFGGHILWFYVLLGIGSVGWAFGNPARQALLPQLVPAEIFSNAVAWNSSVFYIASVTGPITGGFLVAAFQTNTVTAKSLAPAFTLVLLCRIVAVTAIALIRLKPRPENRSEPPVSWESVMAGIRFVWRTKLILATITLDLFAVLFGGCVFLLPVFAKDILRVDARGVGVLMAADACGAICMAMILAHRPPMRRAGTALLLAVTGFGAATIVFGLSKWFWLSLAMVFLMGVFDNISVVVRHTLVQMLTPDKMRGRVSAVNGIFIVSSNDLGGLESGMVARFFGPVASVVSGGVGTILVVLGAICLWPQLLKLGSLDKIRPVAMDEPNDGDGGGAA
jgi:MFS family permease